MTQNIKHLTVFCFFVKFFHKCVCKKWCYSFENMCEFLVQKTFWPLLLTLHVEWLSLLQNRGFCTDGEDCPMSHDINLILDKEWKIMCQHEESKNRRKQHRKRKREKSQGSALEDLTEHFLSELEQAKKKALAESGLPQMDHSSTHLDTEEQARPVAPPQATKVPDSPASTPRFSGHRAGVDAFMTGYCFASYVLRLATSSGGRGKEMAGFPEMLEAVSDLSNKIALAGKPVPLLVTKSQYCSTSACHQAHKSILSSLGLCGIEP